MSGNSTKQEHSWQDVEELGHGFMGMDAETDGESASVTHRHRSNLEKINNLPPWSNPSPKHRFSQTLPGKLFGRGASDDKGPVIGWINALEAYIENDIPIPVNLKFCFEGMEESGSEGLEELIFEQKDKFLKVCSPLAIR